MSQLVLPVVVAVLGTLVITALTPLGESVRELLFATKAAVSGSVVLDGQPSADVRLRLDGADADKTGADGKFDLMSVGDGEHRLHLEAVGAKPRDRTFTVDRGETRLDLGEIEMQPLVRLGYAATVEPPGFGDSRGGSSATADVDYDLTLWIRGDAAVMSRIKSVSYTLPAPLPTAPATGASAQQSFCYRQVGAVSFEDLFVVGGAFTTATAVVDLGDGQPFQISAQPGEPRPPNCPVRRSTSSGQSTTPQPQPPGPVPVPQPVPPRPPALMVAVPDVTGLPEDAATEQLETKGFTVAVRQESGPAGAAGTVLRQSPRGDTQAPKGSTVTVVVAVQNVTVPDVVGVDRDNATEKLEANGFVVEVTMVASPGQAEGTVLSQSPNGGTVAASGSKVTLVVAG